MENKITFSELLNEMGDGFDLNVITAIWSHLSDMEYDDAARRKIRANFIKTLTKKFIPAHATISTDKLDACWAALTNRDYAAASAALDDTQDDTDDFQDNNVDYLHNKEERETPPHAQDAEDSWFGETNNDDYTLNDDNSSEYDDMRNESIEKIKKQFQRFL